ncbi:chemotaxis protein, partial [Vibrio parahaemolyticus]
IKQSIASLVILLSVSFSAFSSDYLKITQIGNNEHVVTGCTGISVGSVVALGFRSLGNSYNGGTCTEIAVSASAVRVSWKYGSKTHDGYMYGSLVSSCPDGEQPNPDTGKCEEP